MFLAVLGCCLFSCSAPETLQVRQFHLRDTEAARGDLFIRAEMNRRLHGAVSEEERKLRRGNYYHLRWRGLSGEKPVRVVFEYRQARTGAAVRKVEKVLGVLAKGEVDLHFIGKEYALVTTSFFVFKFPRHFGFRLTDKPMAFGSQCV